MISQTSPHTEVHAYRRRTRHRDLHAHRPHQRREPSLADAGRGVRPAQRLVGQRPIDGAESDGAEPPLGDWRELPTGTFENHWRGERLDLSQAIEVLVQLGKRSTYVPAGTSAEQ